MRLTFGSLVRRARQTSGIAALEFALLAPMFVMGFAGVVDIGTALYLRMRLESAVAAGANYALTHHSQVNSTNGATLASAIASLVSNSPVVNASDANDTPTTATVVVNNGPSATVTGTGTPAASGTAANADLYYCPTGGAPIWTWGSSTTNGSACTGGGTASRFVSITASYSYTPFFASFGFVTNGTITAGAMVQTQ